MNELSYLTWPALYLSWRDGLDILVIGFLIHRLLLLFRGTASLQAMIGLLFLWLIHALAKMTGLVLTSRFLEGLGTVAVLVIVVVFRNEIRDVLIQTSPLRLALGRPTPEVGTRRLPTLVEAIFRMASARVGALIVLQNRNRLADRIEGGVALDAQLSPQLIETIFFKDTPLHDGAVLIRGGRVERAGAILPLTRRPGLPMEFGTRHRAAIGLSEGTDAVVVVVSEERGEVSMIHKGEVCPVDDPLVLERSLRQLLRREAAAERASGWRREAWRQIVGYAAVCLAVATYWVLFFGGQDSLVTFTTAIDFRNIPPGMELRSATDDDVDVKITGKRPLIEALKPEQVVAFVDLRGVERGGLHRVRLSTDANIEVPLGLKVVQITPESVVLNLERRREAPKAVEPVLRNARPPAGFKMTWSLTPDTIRVVGPETEVARATVRTLPADAGGLDADHRERAIDVPLAPLAGSVRLADGEPRTVRLTLRLLPEAPAADETSPAP